MIKYSEIESRYSDKKLTEEEKDVLKEMESFTDEAIELQFPENYSISIDAEVIDKLASTFGVRRRHIILEHWKSLYESSGWSIKFDNQYQNSEWIFSEKK